MRWTSIGIVLVLDKLKKQIVKVRGAAAAAAIGAAPLIQERLREDARTRRGNVPSFGPMGNIPIRAVPRGEAITVTAPDWVMEKANELGQPKVWGGIVRREVRRAMKDGA